MDDLMAALEHCLEKLDVELDDLRDKLFELEECLDSFEDELDNMRTFLEEVNDTPQVAGNKTELRLIKDDDHTEGL